LPQLVCFDQEIDDRDELSHARDNGDLRLFALRFQVSVERFDGRVVTNGDDRRHVQHASYLAASSANESLARLLARITIDGCNSHEFGDLTSIELSKLWQLSENRRDHDWTDTLNRFQYLDHTLVRLVRREHLSKLRINAFHLLFKHFGEAKGRRSQRGQGAPG